MNDKQSVCVECNEVEKDVSKIITCMYCFSEAHYRCRNIMGKAIRRIKERIYFCSTKCSCLYQKIVELQNNKSLLLESLATELKGTVSEIVSHELKNFRYDIKQITSAIERSQEFLSSKFDAIVHDFYELKNENETLKQELVKMKEIQQTLSTTVHNLEHQTDKSNRDARCNNAVILGVPFNPDDNVYEVVHKVFAGFGANIEPDSITSVSRLSSKSLAPIRVVFRSQADREAVFCKSKEHGKLLSSSIDPKFVINGKSTNVTIRNELTPLAMGLLNEMKGYKDKLEIKYVWSSRGGNVLVKKCENSKLEIIKTRNDLLNIVDRYSEGRNIMVNVHSAP